MNSNKFEIKAETNRQSLLKNADFQGDIYQFKLADALQCNPKLGELLSNDWNFCTDSCMAGAIGAFLPGLLDPELHQLPLLVIQSPHLSAADGLKLADVSPIPFLSSHTPFSTTVLGWNLGSCTVGFDCENPYEGEFLEQLNESGQLLIACTAEEQFFLSAISLDADFMNRIENPCDPSECWAELTLEQRQSSDMASISQELSTVPVWPYAPSFISEGMRGETAYIFPFRKVAPFALAVPTREIQVKTLTEEVRTLCSDLLSLQEQWTCRTPICAELRGSQLGDLIPKACHEFPVLLTMLPDAMHDIELHSFAASELEPVNLISPVFGGHTVLVAHGIEHRLYLNVGTMERTMNLAGELKELVLAFIKGETVLLRYVNIDPSWEDQLGVTLQGLIYCDNKSRRPKERGAAFQYKHIGWPQAQMVSSDDFIWYPAIFRCEQGR